jgi:WhiB family redox-sensing transcriptional regulator
MNETARDLMGASSLLGTGPSELDVRTLPCRLGDPDLWFAESPGDVEAAKALCRDCPLQQACLTGALERHEPWGVWGGELFIGGVVVARKRPRGRPRKHPLPEPVAA